MRRRHSEAKFFLMVLGGCGLALAVAAWAVWRVQVEREVQASIAEDRAEREAQELAELAPFFGRWVVDEELTRSFAGNAEHDELAVSHGAHTWANNIGQGCVFLPSGKFYWTTKEDADPQHQETSVVLEASWLDEYVLRFPRKTDTGLSLDEEYVWKAVSRDVIAREQEVMDKPVWLVYRRVE